MNIESLHVENFKSIRELDVEFSDLNVFVGRNAAGKSNLFEVFQFFRDIRDEGIENAVQLQGGIKHLCNKRIETKEITIELEMSPEMKYRYVSPENGLDRKERMDDRTLRITQSSDSGDPVTILAVDQSEHSVKRNEKKISFENKRLIGDSKPSKVTITSEGGGEVLTDVVSGADVPGDKGTVREILEKQNFNSLLNAPRPRLGSTFDIDTKKAATKSTLKGRTDLQPDGSNLALVIKKLLEDEEQKRKFLGLVSDVLPFVSDTKVETMPDQSLFLEILEEFEPGEDQYIPAEMLSDGTLRVLALIYILYFSDHEKVFIEEPGRNIHPSLIANLMMKVKDAAENTDKQIFLTTHNVEVVKYAPLESIRLVSRDDDGFT